MLQSNILSKTMAILFLATLAWPFNQTLTFFNKPDDQARIATKTHKSKDLLLNHEAPAVKTVVIDAGHGGHDPGCAGNSAKEKHVALAIAKKLAALIRQQHPDIRVILTRDRDVFIPLYKRAKIANDANADLFISIHCNAAATNPTRAHGTETYVMGLHTEEQNLRVAKRENSVILMEDNYQQNYDYDPNSPQGHILLSMFQDRYLNQSIQFAQKVEQQFTSLAKRKSRGVKQAGFVVLKATTMPSVLIEAGFLTNPEEEMYLYSPAGQSAIAKSILNAFSQYKSGLEQTFAQGGQEQLQGNYHVQPKPLNQKTLPPQKATVPMKEKQQVAQSAPQNYYPSNKKDYVKVITPPQTPEKIPNYRATQTPSKFSFDPKDVKFRVQLAVSRKPIDVDLAFIRTLDYRVEIVYEGELIKYEVTSFKDYHEADRFTDQARFNGFPDAVIVALAGNKPIALGEAKRALNIP